MSTTTKVTREQAETVLKLVERRYKTWLAPLLGKDGSVLVSAPGADDCPVLIEDYQGTGNWVVSWETGPSDWAINFAWGGLDEEAYSVLATGEFGHTKGEAYKIAITSPVELPTRLAAEVHVDAYYSCVLGIYEA